MAKPKKSMPEQCTNGKCGGKVKDAFAKKSGKPAEPCQDKTCAPDPAQKSCCDTKATCCPPKPTK